MNDCSAAIAVVEFGTACVSDRPKPDIEKCEHPSHRDQWPLS